MVLSWDAFAQACQGIALAAEEFGPEVVAGIEPGGVVPAAVIAAMLGCGVASIPFPPRGDRRDLRPLVAGRRVLAVDHTAGDGAVLQWATERLRHAGADVRTAALFHARDATVADFTGPVVTAPFLQPWTRYAVRLGRRPLRVVRGGAGDGTAGEP